LHVLSTPPAFVLSQDQTLREELLSRKAVMSHNEATEYTVAASTHDAGYFSTLAPPARWRTDESDLHSSDPAESEERMLLSFQRPPRLLALGVSAGVGAQAGEPRLNGQRKIAAPRRPPKRA
jgi:hypothetical protein